MNKPLSDTMSALVDRMKECDNKIYRHPGGYWAHKDFKYNNGPWFGTPTVQALISRGVAEYSNWQEGRNGRFPIEARLIGDTSG